MSTENFPDVGQRLLAARLKRGLSQAAVAQEAGVPTSYLSRVESGKINPTFRNVLRIARGLDVPLEELVATASGRGRRGGGACPVTAQGACLLDLVCSEDKLTNHSTGEEAYSPRQIKMLRRFAAWLQKVPHERLRAMEALLDQLLDGSSDGGKRPGP